MTPAPHEAATDEMAPLVGLLLETTGTHRDPTSIRAALWDRGSIDASIGWAEALVQALPSFGLRGSRAVGSIEEIGARVGRGQPFVTRGRISGETDRTLVLTDRRGARMRIEDPASGDARWVSASKLASMIVPATEIEWVAVDAAMPLDAIRTGRIGGEGHHHAGPLERLGAWVRLERQDLWAIVIYAAAVGVLGLATPVAVQALVSTVAFGTVLQPLVMLSVVVLAALGLSAIFRGLQAWLVEVLQRRLFVRVVADLAHRLPRVRRDALDGVHAPELVNRFFDVFTVQKTASALLLGGLEIALTITVGLIVLAFYHPLLFALDVLLIVAIATAVLSRARSGTATAIRESKAKYAMAAWLEELALHHGELKLGGGQRYAWDRADDLARSYLSARHDHFVIAFQQLGAMLAIQAIANAAVLGIGGWLVIERQLTLGQLVAAELVVTAVVASLAKVGTYVESTYDLLAALDKLGHLADLPVEREDGAPCDISARAALRLDRVRGGYFDFDVLAAIDLHVQPGERIVLTGPSGGGKSLLVELIAGMREPAGGTIEIDGRDVRDLSLSSMRSRIVAVMRTATVAGTVLENVRLGRPSIDGPRARTALDAVGLLDEVEALENGMKTELLPDGTPLGDGQALRLTIARAIAIEPALLVIDHVLDGIDDATREPLLDALFDPSAPWTLIVVSGDPHVMQRADRVLTLENGALTPRGVER